MKGRTGKRARRESAIARTEKTILAHEGNMELTKRIIEDHVESGSEKFMKFNPNMRILKSTNSAIRSSKELKPP